MLHYLRIPIRTTSLGLISALLLAGFGQPVGALAQQLPSCDSQGAVTVRMDPWNIDAFGTTSFHGDITNNCPVAIGVEVEMWVSAGRRCRSLPLHQVCGK